MGDTQGSWRVETVRGEICLSEDTGFTEPGRHRKLILIHVEQLTGFERSCRSKSSEVARTF